MTPPDQPFPESRPPISRVRRRRARRMIIPQDNEGRTALLVNLSRRAYPSYEFFIFAILCGAILGAGYILDSQALLIFGILLAPLMTPWIGMTLAMVIGSARFFLQTLAALLIGGLLVFLSGLLAGLAVRIWLPRTLNQAFVHSRLWWPDLLVLAIGAILLAASFVRSEEKPLLPSVMLAYELLLPLSASGFGFGSGVGEIWPQGLLVFFVHLAWSILFGLITLLALRFHPLTFGGYAFSIAILLVVLVALVELTGLRKLFREGVAWAPNPIPTAISAPVFTPLPILSGTPIMIMQTPIPIIVQPAVSGLASVTTSPSHLSTLALSPTRTPTITLTSEPTPFYARIQAETGGGVNLRSRPGGPILITLDNGSFVQVLSGVQEYEGENWVRIIAIVSDKTYEGWMIQSVLVTATPEPD